MRPSSGHNPHLLREAPHPIVCRAAGLSCTPAQSGHPIGESNQRVNPPLVCTGRVEAPNSRHAAGIILRPVGLEHPQCGDIQRRQLAPAWMQNTPTFYRSRLHLPLKIPRALLASRTPFTVCEANTWSFLQEQLAPFSYHPIGTSSTCRGGQTPPPSPTRTMHL